MEELGERSQEQVEEVSKLETAPWLSSCFGVDCQFSALVQVNGLRHCHEDRGQFVFEGREMAVFVNHIVLSLCVCVFFFKEPFSHAFFAFSSIPRSPVCSLEAGLYPATQVISQSHEPVPSSVHGLPHVPIISSSQWKNCTQS